MMKRILALCLSCAVLLSLSTTAFAARVGSYSPKPAAGTSFPSKPSRPITGTLTFAQVGPQMRANNLNILAAQEGLNAANAFDREAAYDELKDAIDETNDAIWTMTNLSNNLVEKTVAGLGDALKDIDITLGNLEEILGNVGKFAAGSVIAIGNAAAQKAYLMVQIDNMKAAVEGMEKQLESLEKDEYEKNLMDTTRMVESTIDQIVAAAESLYVTILSTELQLDTLRDTLASTERTLKEMELRYQRGQIAKLSLMQVQQGYQSLTTSVNSLDNTISTMKASLQSMLGGETTGQLTLQALPSMDMTWMDRIVYNKDLEAAKLQSYTLYSAGRTLEDAEETWEEAQDEYSKGSYKYKVAEHTYQSAVYQHDAAVQNFALSFRGLYTAIPPAQESLAAAQSALAYQEKVYAAQELKYQQGNLSANALLDAKDALESARRDVTAAQLELFSVGHSYQQAVELGLVSSGS